MYLAVRVYLVQKISWSILSHWPSFGQDNMVHGYYLQGNEAALANREYTFLRLYITNTALKKVDNNVRE